jgi:hypothetical protein
MPRMPIVILNEIVAAGTILLFDPGTSLDPTALPNGLRTACKIRRKLCLLFLERPTPCARTYANSASEVSREMTLKCGRFLQVAIELDKFTVLHFMICSENAD